MVSFGGTINIDNETSDDDKDEDIFHTCTGCDYTFRESEVFKCESCDGYVCEKCNLEIWVNGWYSVVYPTCGVCEKRVCRKCLTYCSACMGIKWCTKCRPKDAVQVCWFHGWIECSQPHGYQSYKKGECGVCRMNKNIRDGKPIR
jgi:hypothetical protein